MIDRFLLLFVLLLLLLCGFCFFCFFVITEEYYNIVIIPKVVIVVVTCVVYDGFSSDSYMALNYGNVTHYGNSTSLKINSLLNALARRQNRDADAHARRQKRRGLR